MFKKKKVMDPRMTQKAWRSEISRIGGGGKKKTYPIKNYPEEINEFSRIAGYEINIRKSIAFHTLTMNN